MMQAEGKLNAHPGDARSDLTTSLLKIGIDLLSGSVYWKVWCGLCSILGFASMIAFIATVDSQATTKFLFAVIFVFLASCVVWLSVMTRDMKKKELFQNHGQGVPELSHQALSIGNVGMRIALAWIFILLALIALIIALSIVALDGTTRLNGCQSAIIVLAVVFQQAKVFHDPTDAQMLKDIHNKKSAVGGDNV